MAYILKKLYDKPVVNTWKVENPNRLLTELKSKLSGSYSTKDIRWSLEHNRCFINGLVETFGSTPLKAGDSISFFLVKRPIFVLEKERILYEDSHILVYNKPPFLTSEDLAALAKSTLAHRLDRDTSGVILLAKTEEAKNSLEEQFKKRIIYKEYLALIEGFPGKEGTISEKMALIHKREGAVIWGVSSKGIPAKTLWRSIKTDKKHTLIQCLPVTGRTHQIRVHLKHLGFPILGDYTYGSKKKGKSFRPLLHAHRLKFQHPFTQQPLAFSSPLPSDFFLR